MSPNPPEPGNVTTVAIELETGWMFFKVADPKPEPSRMEFLLRTTIEVWFAERPTLTIRKATAITSQSEILGVHVWYDQADSEALKKIGPVEFGIDIHEKISAIHSREYIEAVIEDALRILSRQNASTEALIVVNPRRVAVTLDNQTNRGKVIPAAFIEQAVEGITKERLQAWLRSPSTPFFIMQMERNWTSPET